MALLGISTGTTPNDGTGDSLIVGADKVNKNFQEIYNAIGNGTTIFAGSPNMQVGMSPQELLLQQRLVMDLI